MIDYYISILLEVELLKAKIGSLEYQRKLSDIPLLPAMLK